MAIRIKKLDLRPKLYETYWVGDDAVDKKLSNIPEWARTGDKAFLVAKEGKEPDKVLYRGLTTAEMAILPISNDQETVHPNYLRVAAAIGLVGVGDTHLDRTKTQDGIKILTPAVMESLEVQDMMEKVPFPDVFYPMTVGKLGEEVKEEVKSQDSDISFAEWVGVLVMGATFRARFGSA